MFGESQGLVRQEAGPCAAWPWAERGGRGSRDGRTRTAAHTISGSESQTAFPWVTPGPAPRQGLCLLWTCPHVCSHPQIPHFQAQLLRLAGKNRLTLAGGAHRLYGQTAQVRRCWLHLLTCLEGHFPNRPPEGPTYQTNQHLQDHLTNPCPCYQHRGRTA